MRIPKSIGGGLALVALAIPLSLVAAAPATATTPSEGYWIQASFGYDRTPSGWAGDQDLLYFEELDSQPAGNDVLNPTDDPQAFPREACEYQTIQVDNIYVAPGSSEPVVGEAYTAPFKQNENWTVAGAAHYVVADNAAIQDLCTTVPPVTVTVPAPVVNDVCEPSDGDTQDTYTIPESEGVDYSVDGEIVAAGTYPAEGTEVVVTATAREGYTLEGDSTWTLEFSKDACPAARAPVAAEPTSEDVCEPSDGAVVDTVTIPESDVVEYSIDGTVVEAGTHLVEGTEAVVTATSLDGSAIDGTSTWTFTFTKVDCEPVTPPSEPATPPSEPATPPSGPNSGTPSASDVCEPGDGTTNDTLLIPSVEGIRFSLDGVAVEPGEHTIAGTTVVLTAEALEGYTAEGTTEWTFTFTKDACDSATPPVTSESPTTSPAPTAPVASTPDSQLARTGAESVVPLGLAALALVALGGALFVARRVRTARD